MGVYSTLDGSGKWRNFRIKGESPDEDETRRIAAAIERFDAAAGIEKPVPEKEEAGFTDSLGIGFGRAKTGLMHAGSEALNAVGAEGMADSLYDSVVESRKANQENEAKFKSVGDLYNDGRYIRAAWNSLVESTPQLVATAVPTMVMGPAGIPVSAAVGTPFFAGSNLERQVAESEDGVAHNPGQAFLAAPVQAATEGLIGMVPGGNLAKGITGGLKGAAAAATKGFALEGGTEIAQQGLERAQADLSLTDDGAIDEYKMAGLLGGIAGGALGAPKGFKDGRAAKLNRDYEAGQLDRDLAEQDILEGQRRSAVDEARNAVDPDRANTPEEEAALAEYRNKFADVAGLPAPDASRAPRLTDRSGQVQGDGFTMDTQGGRKPAQLDPETRARVASTDLSGPFKVQPVAPVNGTPMFAVKDEAGRQASIAAPDETKVAEFARRMNEKAKVDFEQTQKRAASDARVENARVTQRLSAQELAAAAKETTRPTPRIAVEDLDPAHREGLFMRNYRAAKPMPSHITIDEIGQTFGPEARASYQERVSPVTRGTGAIVDPTVRPRIGSVDTVEQATNTTETVPVPPVAENGNIEAAHGEQAPVETAPAQATPVDPNLGTKWVLKNSDGQIVRDNIPSRSAATRARKALNDPTIREEEIPVVARPVELRANPLAEPTPTVDPTARPLSREYAKGENPVRPAPLPTREEAYDNRPEVRQLREAVAEAGNRIGAGKFQLKAKRFLEDEMIAPKDNAQGPAMRGRVVEGKTTVKSNPLDSVAEVSLAAHMVGDEGQRVKAVKRTSAEELGHVFYDDITADAADKDALLTEAKARKVTGANYTHYQQAERQYAGQDPSVIEEEAIVKMLADFAVNYDGRLPTTETPAARNVIGRFFDWLKGIGRSIRHTKRAEEIMRDFESGKVAENVAARAETMPRAEPSEHGSETATRTPAAPKAEENTTTTETAPETTSRTNPPEEAAPARTEPPRETAPAPKAETREETSVDNKPPKAEPETAPKSEEPKVRYSFSAAADPGTRVPPLTDADIRSSEYMPVYTKTAQLLEKALGLPYYHVMDNVAGNIGLAKKKGLGERKAQLKAGVTSFIENFQDDKFSVARMMDALKAAGGKITDQIDTYMGLEVMGARTSARIAEANRTLYRPFTDKVKNIGIPDATFEGLKGKSKVLDSILNNKKLKDENGKTVKGLALVEAYAMAKHAPERNAYIAGKDGKEVELDADGNPIDDNYAGMTDKEAAEIVKAIEGTGMYGQRVKQAHRALLDIIKDTNDIRYRNGLISKDVYESGGIGENYVPLRGIDDAMDEDVDLVYGINTRARRGVDVRGKEDRAAQGRESIATNVVANTLAQHSQAISRGERNRVATSLWGLVEANEGGVIDGFVQVVDDPKYVYRKVGGKEVRMVDRDWMNNDENRLFVAKINGEEKIMHIADKRVYQALRPAIGSTPDSSNAVIRVMGGLNRYLATINTSWNPEFLISNALRDIQTAMLTNAQFDQKGLGKAIVKDWPAAFKAAKNHAFNESYDGEWGQYFKELEMEGGLTSFEGIKNVEDHIAEMNKEAQNAITAGGGNSNKAVASLKALKSTIENSNQSVENTVRLAVYANLRKRGMSQARAAQASKNATVNFNRGGRQKAIMNSMYLFYNASLQGSVAMFNAAARSPKVRTALLGVLAAGAAQDLLMSAMVPDYDDIPEYTKETNWLLPFPGVEKGYLKIPLPYGMNAIHNVGRNIAASARGQKTPGEALSSAGGVLAGVFNPLGASQSFLNTVAPTILDPLIDLTANQDFTGREIVPGKNGPSGLDVPASQSYWNSASAPAIGIAAWMNEATGGSSIRKGVVDVSPEQIEYVGDFVTGGAGAFVARMFQTGGTFLDLVNGELDEADVNKVILARKFVGNITTDTKAGTYFQTRDEVMTAYEEYRKAMKDGDTETVISLRKKYGKELAVAPILKKLDAQRSKVNRLQNQVRDRKGLGEEERKRLVDLYQQQKKDLVARAAEIAKAGGL